MFVVRISADRPWEAGMPITEHHKRKRGVNLALAALLLGLVLLFFAITLVKFGGGS